MEENSETQRLDEVRDVHPIFRANPFLIEDGLTLVRGEKHLAEDALKRIDLVFRDNHGLTTFVEIKWSDVSEDQMRDYQRLVGVHSPGSRIIWVVPSDLEAKARVTAKFGIELKLFDRQLVYNIGELQKEANRCLAKVLAILSAPFTTKMHTEDIAFDNAIAACYFEGRAKTDKAVKKLGLKQQSVGRQLDLVRSLASSHTGQLHKEKVMLLIQEVFAAPYSYKPTKFWRIMENGFIELIQERQGSLERIASEIYEIVNGYRAKYETTIRTIFGNDVRRYDLCAMLLSGFSVETGKQVFRIDELLKRFIDEFDIRPTLPPPRIKHGVLNQWVENIVSIRDYENDLAKRVIEIASLKRMLIPRMGTVDMWILTPSRREGELVAQRQPCQMLSYNADTSLYLGISEYSKEAKAK